MFLPMTGVAKHLPPQTVFFQYGIAKVLPSSIGENSYFFFFLLLNVYSGGGLRYYFIPKVALKVENCYINTKNS